MEGSLVFLFFHLMGVSVTRCHPSKARQAVLLNAQVVSQHLQHLLGSLQPQKEFWETDMKSTFLLGCKQVKKL